MKQEARYQSCGNIMPDIMLAYNKGLWLGNKLLSEYCEECLEKYEDEITEINNDSNHV